MPKMENNFAADFDLDPETCLNKYSELLMAEEDTQGMVDNIFRNAKKVTNFLKEDESTLEHVSTAFHFYAELLRCIAITSKADNIDRGLKLLKNIFKNSSKVLMNLLKSDPDSVTVGLKFLTRAAMVSEGTATEVLTSFNWQDYNLKLGMLHYEPRKWIFRLILVFMNKEDCMRQFCTVGLLRRTLCYLGEQKDSSIQQILETMHQKILMSNDIPKDMKAKIFSPNQLIFLLPIYAHASSTDFKKKSLVGKLHNLMLALYSNPECGIVSEAKTSIHYLTLLVSEKFLLEIPQGKELIESAISVWPNLVSNIIAHFEDNLESINTNTLVSLITLLQFVLENDSQWKSTKGSLQPLQVDVIKKSLTTVLHHGSNVQRLCLTIINLIYKRLQEVSNDGDGYEAYAYLKSICPVEEIVQIWTTLINHELKSNAEQKDAEVIERLNIVANILHSYFEIYPEIKLSNFLNISNMLKELSLVCFNKTASSQYISTCYYLISLTSMALNRDNLLILDMSNNISDILAKSPLVSILSQFIRWQIAPDNVIMSYPTSLAESILCSTIISEISRMGIRVYESELKMWLKEAGKGDEKSRLEFLTRTIVEAIKCSYVYKPVLYSLQKTPEQSIEEENLLSLLDEEDYVDNEDVCVLPINEPFSSLVLSAIDILKLNVCEEHMQYFSMVMQHYVHSLSNPEILSGKLLSVNGVISKELSSFLEKFLTQHNSCQSLESANLPVRLDAIYKESSCPKIKHFANSMPDMLTDDVDNEFICRQILYYVKAEKYKSNQSKRPKHYQFFCNLLIELLKIWTVKGIFPPFKFLLNSSFLLESYIPFIEVDCLNKLIICLLLFSSKIDNLQESVKLYCNKTIDTFKSIVSIGDTDVYSPFDIFLNKSIFNVPLLEVVINCCLKFSVTENESICELLIKLLELLNEFTRPTNLPSEDTILRLTSLMFCLDKQWDCADYRTLSELIQKSVVNFLLCLKRKNFNQEFKKNILVCENLLPDLKCQLLSMDNLSSKEIAERLLSMERFTLADEAPFIAALTKKSSDKLTVKAFAKCKKPLLQWAKNTETDASAHCEQILKYFVAKNIINAEESTKVADLWYDRIINKNETIPPHILNMNSLFESLGPEYKQKFLLICMQSVQQLYLPDCQLSPKHIELVVNSPQKISLLLESATYDSEHPHMKPILKSFCKQVIKVGITDQRLGPSYFDCLVKLLPYVKNTGNNIKRMFQILCSHSQFNDVLDGCHGIPIKEEVVKLMLALLEENLDLCDATHVPLLLMSYHASVSTCDQHLLKLLQLYDKANCLNTFPPVVWGSAAKQFFSSKAGGKVDIGALKSKAFQDTLSLINSEKVVRTAMAFDPSLDLSVTRMINKSGADIYDQRYLLMLAAFITSNDVARHFPILKSNMLTIAIAALSSSVDLVWATGALIMTHLCQLFSSKHNSKKFLRYEWLIRILGHSLNGKKDKLPYVFTQLLIEIALSIETPTHPNAKQFYNFVFSKPSVNIDDLQQLNTWLNPQSAENAIAIQENIIHVITRSIKSSDDWKFLQKQDIINHLLSLSMSSNVAFQIRWEIFDAFHKVCTDFKTARRYFIKNQNFAVFLSLIRKDVQASSELKNKEQTLKQLDAFEEILNKTDGLCLGNIKLSTKRPLLQDDDSHPRKTRRLSSTVALKNEAISIKEEEECFSV